MRKWLLTFFIALAVVFVFLIGGFFILNESLPSGTPGPEADALADKILSAIHHENWDSTAAIIWTFRGNHHFLWDKKRHFVRVRWENYEVLLNINQRTGIARKDDVIIPSKAAAQLIETAWKYWANDSFWLNPISKIYDPGTTRQLISSDDGFERLLVIYNEGGVTPGDSYLWIVDTSGLPVAWKMWVSILPIGGIKITWENWITLSTGVKIATQHNAAISGFSLTNIQGAASLSDLTSGTDPFMELMQ